jgi:hypothetical protein
LEEAAFADEKVIASRGDLANVVVSDATPSHLPPASACPYGDAVIGVQMCALAQGRGGYPNV